MLFKIITLIFVGALLSALPHCSEQTSSTISGWGTQTLRTVSITTGATDTEAQCNEGEELKGGFCNCGTTGAITRSLRKEDNETWICACASVTTSEEPVVTANCYTDGPTVGRQSTQIGTAGTETTAECGENETAVGGGVDCGSEGTHRVLASFPAEDGKSWTGKCNSLGSAAFVHVYCVGSTPPTVSRETGKALSLGTASASCSTGILLDGGGDCDTPNSLNVVSTTDGSTLTVTCNGGGGGTAYAYCGTLQ